MDIENTIQRIIDNGDIEHMHILSDILEDVMEELKKYDKDCYEEYEMKLYKMAYGSKLTIGMAKKIVSKMRPFGEKWSIEETEELQRQYGITNIDAIDFFTVINSAYNDYNDIFNDNIEMYVRFAIDFINDEDAKSNKIFLYFMTIPY